MGSPLTLFLSPTVGRGEERGDLVIGHWDLVI